MFNFSFLKKLEDLSAVLHVSMCNCSLSGGGLSSYVTATATLNQECMLGVPFSSCPPRITVDFFIGCFSFVFSVTLFYAS